MVAYFSRILLLCIVAFGAMASSVSALTSAELKSWSIENGIISSADPLSATVSRASAAPLYLGIADYYWGSGNIDVAMKNITTTCTFSDVRSESQISDACKLGLLRGMEEGRFYPQNNLTPAQAMVILMRTI